MAKQKVTIEVDVPEGYECTGEYRAPKTGEKFLLAGYHNGMATNALDNWEKHYRTFILRKVEKKGA